MDFIIKKAILPFEKNLIKEFLEKEGLKYDSDINHSWYAVDENKIIGTISCSEYIIKGFAISNEYQGLNLANALISRLFSEMNCVNDFYFQIYTKPKNKDLFISLGFKEIITTCEVCLLETKNSSINDVLIKLKNDYNLTSKSNGSIVMNANPFTLGHLHLIKEALRHHEKVLVFVLEEDKSYFSYLERFNLVKEGVKSLDNVIVLPSSKYIISSLTFPTYFLKNDIDKTKVEATVDAKIFKEYFMPIFNITKRYVALEKDETTKKYNEVLKEVLKNDLVEIKRLTSEKKIISASRVRELYQEKNFDEIKKIVPLSTYDFLRKKGQNNE